ncbi:EGF-like domain-containing protein [Tieghemostelium lacteum]|uniref:EGF-like domain-containing protein n=1 Tax=Tieghemostelium lacteum TaxID=361077 RepID=A0A151ZC89_TIELA|nr:EGF-like domain-containing protein [Tieghemostelium lacteum]|eukprot:KYQ91560.1 EGF-like domain-containing protein [Tieghemostelium lacteum]
MESIISRSIKTCLEFGFKIVSFWVRLWLIPLNSVLDWFYERVYPVFSPILHYLFDNRSKILKISLYSILLVAFAFVLSLFSFYLVYSCKVPKVTTESALYFDYSNTKKHQVSASADLNAELQKNKLYNIYLELELPESPKNIDMGMFMVCMVINNNDKWSPNRIHSNCKPAMLKYTSPQLKNVKNFVNMVPFIFGFYEEKQYIHLPMIENLLSTRYYHTISIEVTIMNSDIQIYSSSLKIMANLSGIEYYLYYYPSLSFIIGVGCLFIFWLTTIAFTFVAVYLYRYFKTHDMEIVSQEHIEEDHEEQEDIHQEELPIGEEEPLPSSSKKSWDVDNSEFLKNRFSSFAHVNNNNNVNSNNNNNNTNATEKDTLTELLKQELKKYQTEQKNLKMETSSLANVDDNSFEKDKLQQQTTTITNNTNNNNLSSESEILEPQPIMDDLSSSTSSTISNFTPINTTSDSDSDDNNNNNNDTTMSLSQLDNNDSISNLIRKRK